MCDFFPCKMHSDNFFVYNVLAGSLHVDKLKLMQALYTGGNIATAIGNETNDATSLLHKVYSIFCFQFSTILMPILKMLQLNVMPL